MTPAQYIILNKGAGMSTGKAAAQAAHASVMGLLAAHTDKSSNPFDNSIVNRWLRGGHYMKLVLEVPDAEALRVAERYINDRGFKTAMIIDEGRTEFDGVLTPTAIGTGVVDKDWPHAQDTFGEFRLYSDPPQRPESEVTLRKPTWRDWLGLKEKGDAR